MHLAAFRSLGALVLLAVIGITAWMPTRAQWWCPEHGEVREFCCCLAASATPDDQPAIRTPCCLLLTRGLAISAAAMETVTIRALTLTQHQHPLDEVMRPAAFHPPPKVRAAPAHRAVAPPCAKYLQYCALLT
jgi:hypothetical protein